ncbi:MAG: mechanosensitive ion channel [Proteobacteria bacterium]|nr:mechanosensitive ion channel [Pseudomonadota bacterium]MCP4916516.1 mechanosensitive ion channel [Pseudomonadota bacterium]
MFEGGVRAVLAIELLHVGETPLTVGTLGLSLGVILIAWFLSRWARVATERAFHMRGVTDPGRIGVTKRLIHYAVLLIGFSVAMETAGIALSGLFAAGAIFAVGVGFAMQNITQNFVSGVILLLERSIKPGDVLEFEGEPVMVKHMFIRSTVVRTLDEVDIVVPNSMLVQTAVRNLTLTRRTHRVHARVGVHYDSDMAQVKEVLTYAASALPGRDKARPPVVFLKDFGDSSVVWDVFVWTDEVWGEQRLRADLNEVIWFALKDADVVIAYPQIDVHVIGTTPPPPEASD